MGGEAAGSDEGTGRRAGGKASSGQAVAPVVGEMPLRAGLKLQDNGRMPVWELGALEIVGSRSWGGGSLGPSLGPALRQGSSGLTALSGALSLLSSPGLLRT